MAAALAQRIAGDRVRIRSAGSESAAAIHPNVLLAMREIGIDLATQSPRVLTDGDARQSDVIVTMGCGDACPVYPGKRYEDWELDDPAGEDIETVRRVRDEIDARVQKLLSELAPGD